MTLRNERVRKALMREISDILLKEVKDPNITGIVSITDVEVSHDNSFAKVYYSVMTDSEEARARTEKAIAAVTPRVRYEVGKRIRLRHTPELRFIFDVSLERGLRITKLIDKISKGEL